MSCKEQQGMCVLSPDRVDLGTIGSKNSEVLEDIRLTTHFLNSLAEFQGARVNVEAQRSSLLPWASHEVSLAAFGEDLDDIREVIGTSVETFEAYRLSGGRQLSDLGKQVIILGVIADIDTAKIAGDIEINNPISKIASILAGEQDRIWGEEELKALVQAAQKETA